MLKSTTEYILERFSSINIIVEPEESAVREAVNKLLSTDSKFFDGVKKIVVERNASSPYAGKAQSDGVIFIAADAIRGNLNDRNDRTAYVAELIKTLAHEVEHIRDGFKSGEGVAEQAEKAIEQRLNLKVEASDTLGRSSAMIELSKRVESQRSGLASAEKQVEKYLSALSAHLLVTKQEALDEYEKHRSSMESGQAGLTQDTQLNQILLAIDAAKASVRLHKDKFDGLMKDLDASLAAGGAETDTMVGTQISGNIGLQLKSLTTILESLDENEDPARAGKIREQINALQRQHSSVTRDLSRKAPAESPAPKDKDEGVSGEDTGKTAPFKLDSDPSAIKVEDRRQRVLNENKITYRAVFGSLGEVAGSIVSDLTDLAQYINSAAREGQSQVQLLVRGLHGFAAKNSRLSNVLTKKSEVSDDKAMEQTLWNIDNLREQLSDGDELLTATHAFIDSDSRESSHFNVNFKKILYSTFSGQPGVMSVIEGLAGKVLKNISVFHTIVENSGMGIILNTDFKKREETKFVIGDYAQGKFKEMYDSTVEMYDGILAANTKIEDIRQSAYGQFEALQQNIDKARAAGDETAVLEFKAQKRDLDLKFDMNPEVRKHLIVGKTVFKDIAALKEKFKSVSKIRGQYDLIAEEISVLDSKHLDKIDIDIRITNLTKEGAEVPEELLQQQKALSDEIQALQSRVSSILAFLVTAGKAVEPKDEDIQAAAKIRNSFSRSIKGIISKPVITKSVFGYTTSGGMHLKALERLKDDVRVSERRLEEGKEFVFDGVVGNAPGKRIQLKDYIQHKKTKMKSLEREIQFKKTPQISEALVLIAAYVDASIQSALKNGSAEGLAVGNFVPENMVYGSADPRVSTDSSEASRRLAQQIDRIVNTHLLKVFSQEYGDGTIREFAASAAQRVQGIVGDGAATEKAVIYAEVEQLMNNSDEYIKFRRELAQAIDIFISNIHNKIDFNLTLGTVSNMLDPAASKEEQESAVQKFKSELDRDHEQSMLGGTDSYLKKTRDDASEWSRPAPTNYRTLKSSVDTLLSWKSATDNPISASPPLYELAMESKSSRSAKSKLRHLVKEYINIPADIRRRVDLAVDALGKEIHALEAQVTGFKGETSARDARRNAVSITMAERKIAEKKAKKASLLDFLRQPLSYATGMASKKSAYAEYQRYVTDISKEVNEWESKLSSLNERLQSEPNSTELVRLRDQVTSKLSESTARRGRYESAMTTLAEEIDHLDLAIQSLGRKKLEWVGEEGSQIDLPIAIRIKSDPIRDVEIRPERMRNIKIPRGTMSDSDVKQLSAAMSRSPAENQEIGKSRVAKMAAKMTNPKTRAQLSSWSATVYGARKILAMSPEVRKNIVNDQAEATLRDLLFAWSTAISALKAIQKSAALSAAEEVASMPLSDDEAAEKFAALAEEKLKSNPDYNALMLGLKTIDMGIQDALVITSETIDSMTKSKIDEIRDFGDGMKTFSRSISPFIGNVSDPMLSEQPETDVVNPYLSMMKAEYELRTAQDALHKAEIGSNKIERDLLGAHKKALRKGTSTEDFAIMADKVRDELYNKWMAKHIEEVLKATELAVKNLKEGDVAGIGRGATPTAFADPKMIADYKRALADAEATFARAKSLARRHAEAFQLQKLTGAPYDPSRFTKSHTQVYEAQPPSDKRQKKILYGIAGLEADPAHLSSYVSSVKRLLTPLISPGLERNTKEMEKFYSSEHEQMPGDIGRAKLNEKKAAVLTTGADIIRVAAEVVKKHENLTDEELKEFLECIDLGRFGLSEPLSKAAEEKPVKYADPLSPKEAATTLVRLIRHLMHRSRIQNRHKFVMSVREHLSEMQPFHLSRKKSNPSAAIGATLNIVKNVLQAQPPLIIANILNLLYKML